MADVKLFELVAEQLERLTDMSRLEARGTLRLALKEALFDPERIVPSEMKAVVQKVLLGELEVRRIERPERVCESLVALIEDLAFASTQPDSADEIFGRLIRRRG